MSKEPTTSRAAPLNGKRVSVSEINRLLRKEYGGVGPIIDLAQIESTYPNGSRESFQRGGDIFEQLLHYLASVPD